MNCARDTKKNEVHKFVDHNFVNNLYFFVFSAKILPTDNMPQNKRTPQQQALYDRQTVAFYDIDKKGWRSMRIDTIWSYQRAMKLTE